MVDNSSGGTRPARCSCAKRRSRRGSTKAAAAARRCRMASASSRARVSCALAAVASTAECAPAAAAALAPFDCGGGDEDVDVRPSGELVSDTGGTGPPMAADAVPAAGAGR